MTISLPYVNAPISPAALSAPNQPQAVLVIGQKLSAGTATAGALIQNIGNNGEESTLFGAKSQIAAAVRGFKSINTVSRLDAICLADNGTTYATGTFAITGPATANGVLIFTVGSQYNNSYQIDINSGDSATTIGTALAAAINADSYSLVSAVNTTGSVALTARNAGTVANDYSLKVSGSVTGVAVAITAFASGATDPVVTGIFDVVGSLRYQTIIWPQQYTLSVLQQFLDPRWNVNNAILDGVGIITNIDTYANLITYNTALDDQNIFTNNIQLITRTALKGAALTEFDFVMSAQIAAIRSLRLTVGADISQYIIGGGGAADEFGGPALASLPYFNTPFPYLTPIDNQDEFTDEEIQALNAVGGSTLGNNQVNTMVIAGEFVTTYKTNDAGNPDATYQYLNAVDTISNVREYMFNNFKVDYAQTRLTNGAVIGTRKMANGNTIAASASGYYKTLSGPLFVLTQAGPQAIAFFKNNLSVTINLQQGLATVSMVTPIVTQLRTIDAPIQIAFSAGG